LPKVLIVDDDNDIREIVQFALEMNPGWSVEGEPAGENAVARAAAISPHVILLDVNLEGMDGPTTLATLRKDPRTALVPVIFLTGTTRESDVAALRELGANGIIAKPFDPIALPRVIARQLGWRE
jgi:DNA-binding response OmpR family regulator